MAMEYYIYYKHPHYMISNVGDQSKHQALEGRPEE
jgi:hypothetical protein